MDLKKMFESGHLESNDGQLGICICSVDNGVIRYHGRTFWNLDELMEGQDENICRRS